MSDAPRAKRVPPADVPSVTVGATRVDVVHWGRDEGYNQNGGLLRAVDTRTGAELWMLKVYQTEYDPQMESDVQDVFIKSMRKAVFGDKLLIADENGRKFAVDLATRAVTPDETTGSVASPLALLATSPFALPTSAPADEPAGALGAKRVAPPTVPPRRAGNLRIAAVDGRPGVIEAFDVASGASLWTLKVYDTVYQPGLETDVQDVFITGMRCAGHGRVRIDDENGRHWLVDLATRKVTPG